MVKFKINDRVKWFDFVGSLVPNYGKIVKLTPKFADVFDTRIEKVIRVRQTILNWD